MELTDRRRKILRAVVDNYIQSAEPVGSKAISSMPDVGFSSATIRNEMAELEAMGLLEQPHTSAGRIPSAAGYRLYVDELMQDYRLTIDETASLNDALRLKMVELDKVVSEAGKVVSKLTNYPAYTLTTRNDPNVAVRRFELILIDELSVIIIVMSTGDIIKNKLIKSPEIYSDSDIKLLTAVLNSGLTDVTPEQFTPELLRKIERNSGPAAPLLPYVVEFALEVLNEEREGLLYVTGETKLLTHPEYHDLDKAQRVIDSLSTRELAAMLPEASEDDPVKILIGPENVSEALKDTSVVVARYDIGGGMHGMIGVVGPTRMDYAKVAARLSYFAEGLNKLFHPQSSLPQASDDNTNDDGGNHGQE